MTTAVEMKTVQVKSTVAVKLNWCVCVAMFYVRCLNHWSFGYYWRLVTISELHSKLIIGCRGDREKGREAVVDII